jgi:hypothetical protein
LAGFLIHCARGSWPGRQGCPSGRACGPALTALLTARHGIGRSLARPMHHRRPTTQTLDRPGTTDKQGSKLVRWAAMEAVARYHGGDHLHASFRAIAERRGKKKAQVAIARKVLTLVYYGLRDGEIRCLRQPDAA